MPHYLLSWTDPNERLFDITIRFVAPCDAPRLLLPAWRPGRYLIQDYAANVREWSPSMEKDGKSSWRVPDARAGEEVEIRYRYYAGVLDAGSSFLDDDEAYFNGSNLFMLVDGLREEPHRLTVAAPADWRIETQLARENEQTFVARDYDYLIDSPTIAAAAMTRHTFTEDGARVHLVFRGDEGVDTERYVEPVRAVTRSMARLFGGLPFREYRFLYHVGDKWHGVEHEDSCSIIVKRTALGTDDDRLVSITSHELFHVWNVKRIVPARFTPYDYSIETPTRLLWVMEGMTSYYGDLMLRRAGLWSETEYVEHLRHEIEMLENLPGRHILSLAQASFDGWLSDPAHRHDHANSWISFYNKGEIVSALLDLTIRNVTNGEKSLDDVVRVLWTDYRVLEEDGFERAVAHVADVGDFFGKYVYGTDPLPYDEVFALAGLALDVKPSDASRSTLGARVRVQEGALVVDHALRGGAAMRAGLLPGDEILSVGGDRVTTVAALEAALRAVPVGDSTELLIQRAGRMRTLMLTGTPDPRVTVDLRVTGESKMRDAWLNHDA
jgi:predicted metalloprotease with PDZ domain